MTMLARLRAARDRSALLRTAHPYLRGAWYRALDVLRPGGMNVDLPGGCRVRLAPRLLGLRPDLYEPELARFLDEAVRPGMTVLDIGAHVGLHTLRLSRRVGAHGRVIALEPSPAAAGLLRRHLDWNGGANVTVVQAAVDAAAGEVDFVYRPDPFDPGGFANSLAYDISGRTARVRTLAIDDLCEGLAPDLIKIDVEGYEARAIAGAARTLAAHAPVLAIAFHPGPMRAVGDAPADLAHRLIAAGYRARRLVGAPLAGEPGFEEIVFEKRGAAS